MRMAAILAFVFLPAAAVGEVLDMGRGRPGDVLHIHHPPDPVNVRNGNFYLPVQDLYLPCFGFPLEVYRSYNSVSTRSGPFGRGWTFNYDLKIAVGTGGKMTVMEADGYVNEYEAASDAPKDKSSLIDILAAARKKADVEATRNPAGKGEAFYQEYRKRLSADDAFFRRQSELYAPAPPSSEADRFLSTQRGTTTLERTRDGFRRSTETGRVEDYDRNGLLTRISNRNDNFLSFDYDGQSRLSRVTDLCGQTIRITYASSGRIASIGDSLGRVLSYSYDANDRLISATGTDGTTARYAYDGLGRMTELVFSDGSKIAIEYDKKTGFAVKQIGPGTKVTEYVYGRGGESRWATVKDNQGLNHRYEYIDAKSQVVFVDSQGKKTVTTLSVCCGKPVSIVDDKGVGETFRYDEGGNLLSKTGADGRTTTFEYERRFNLPAQIREPDGSTLRFLYDGRGNITYVSRSSGENIKLTTQKYGKIESMTNEKDVTIRFAYSQAGKPQRVQKLEKGRIVGTIEVAYSRAGDIETVTYEPKKPEVMQDIKNTLADFMRFLKPSGVELEI